MAPFKPWESDRRVSNAGLKKKGKMLHKKSIRKRKSAKETSAYIHVACANISKLMGNLINLKKIMINYHKNKIKLVNSMQKIHLL